VTLRVSRRGRAAAGAIARACELVESRARASLGADTFEQARAAIAARAWAAPAAPGPHGQA
jgi:hypothetical protein